MPGSARSVAPETRSLLRESGSRRPREEFALAPGSKNEENGSWYRTRAVKIKEESIVWQKKIVGVLLGAILGLVVAQGGAWAMSPTERINESTSILREMARQNDARYMGNLLRSAKGVAIFPSVVKAGLVFGGKFGEGILLRHDPAKNRWYGPSFIDMGGVSWGLQIGVSSTALVLVITNERGMEGFTGDEITLGGDLAVAAGPSGRSTEAATDGRLKASIYSYSMTKGLFAGLSLEGAVIDTRQDKNREYWKGDRDVERILKTSATDARMKSLVKALGEVIRTAPK